MLPKEKRINLKKDFTWVANGEKFNNQYLKFFYRFQGSLEPKIGIALSKASFSKAVERNKIRRLVSSEIEKLYQKLPKGLYLMIMPKASLLSLESQDFRAVFEKSLAEKGLLKTKNDKNNLG